MFQCYLEKKSRYQVKQYGAISLYLNAIIVDAIYRVSIIIMICRISDETILDKKGGLSDFI